MLVRSQQREHQQVYVPHRPSTGVLEGADETLEDAEDEAAALDLLHGPF